MGLPLRVKNKKLTKRARKDESIESSIYRNSTTGTSDFADSLNHQQLLRGILPHDGTKGLKLQKMLVEVTKSLSLRYWQGIHYFLARVEDACKEPGNCVILIV